MRHVSTQEDVGTFFWRKKTDPDRKAPARYKGRDDDELRKAEYICKEEILAINDVLSLDGDPTEVARYIGIARLNQKTRERFENVLEKHSN